MTTLLATVDTTGAINGSKFIAVDEIGPTTGDDTGVVASPWSRNLTADEIEDGEWDAILAEAGWTVTGDWEDHGGYRTAEVEATPETNAWTLTIVSGPQPNANGDELTPDHSACTVEIMGRLEAAGYDEEYGNHWVLVTPADENPGQLYNVIGVVDVVRDPATGIVVPAVEADERA
jgi:hypothetical protein